MLSYSVFQDTEREFFICVYKNNLKSNEYKYNQIIIYIILNFLWLDVFLIISFPSFIVRLKLSNLVYTPD